MLPRIYAMILSGCRRIRLPEPNIQGRAQALNRFLINAIGLSFRLTLMKPT